jgi:hypothetical protein
MPPLYLILILQSLRIGPSGVAGFATNILTVKYMVGPLRWGIGPWSGEDNTTNIIYERSGHKE